MYAVVDLETTGGYASGNRVTEVAIYLFDGKRITDEYHTLVNPGRPIPPYISLLTGIDNEMVSIAPNFEDIASVVNDMTRDRILVAHNAGFDYSFLRREFRMMGINFNRKRICTVRLSRKILPGLHSYGLGTLCAQLNIPIENRHRAFGDARATVSLLDHLIKHDRNDHIALALNRSSREGILPPNLDAEEFKKLPDETGVYYFLDKKGKVIYVGKAQNIQQRVLSHFQQFHRSRRAMSFRNQIAHVTYQICGNDLIALLLESHEIKKFWPKYNRSQRFTTNCWGIHCYTDRVGYHRLLVSKSSPGQSPIISFKSFAEAWGFLRRKVEAHNLCQKLSNIQRVDHACSGYDTGSCAGACIARESPEAYNSKVTQSLEDFNHLNNSYLLLGPGRYQHESSLVWVENGIYRGFGYAEGQWTDTSIEELTSSVTPYPDNQDVQRIIGSYLRKHPHCRRIKL